MSQHAQTAGELQNLFTRASVLEINLLVAGGK
jgi:hypothetical protein